MTLKEKIMPALVLTLICVISSALLVIVYNLTYTDDTGVITDRLAGGLTDIYGSNDGFYILMNEDNTPKTYEGVTSVITDGKGRTAFEVTADGYNKNGLHLLIGFDNKGAVCGIGVLSVTETPGLGTKAAEKGFLGQFTGMTSPREDIDMISGATRSSKGVKNAVDTTIEAYNAFASEGEIYGRE